MNASTRVDWPAVAVFAVTSVLLAWLVALPLWLRGEGLADPLLGVIAAAMMFTPALATVAALLVQRRTRGRRGARTVLRELGMWPLRPAWRTIGMTVAMILAAPLLIVAGLVLLGVFGLVTYDLTGFSGFVEAIRSTSPTGEVPLPPQVLVGIQLALIPIGAIVNIPFGFGEEVGWRGWLLPALRPLGVWPALLLSGAFWGFWHTPLILLGYNFAEPNAWGVLLMIIACALFGVLLGWTRLRTGSVWPAAVGHGAFNASAGLGILFVAADSPMPAAAVAGPLGMVMWIVFAAVIVVLVALGQFRRGRVDVALAPDPTSAGGSSLPTPPPARRR